MRRLTGEEYEELYAKALYNLRVKEVGKRWLDTKADREDAAMKVYAQNKAGGKLGGRNKHIKYSRGIPKKPHETTVKVNKMILEGKTNQEIAQVLDIMPKTVGSIIRRNQLPREELL
jgi:DNA-binding NarL/FixJ family response regulator